MKINGASPTPPTARKKAAARKDGAVFEAAGETTSSRAANAASGPMGVASIDALLALQGEDFDSPKKRATGRAFTLLDLLDDIKIALLEGGVPQSKLNALLGALSATRDDTRDEKLETVLDEVETRAMVELAKHETRPA